MITRVSKARIEKNIVEKDDLHAPVCGVSRCKMGVEDWK